MTAHSSAGIDEKVKAYIHKTLGNRESGASDDTLAAAAAGIQDGHCCAHVLSGTSQDQSRDPSEASSAVETALSNPRVPWSEILGALPEEEDQSRDPSEASSAVETALSNPRVPWSDILTP